MDVLVVVWPFSTQLRFDMARAGDSSTCRDTAGMVVTGRSGSGLDSEADGGEFRLSSGFEALVPVDVETCVGFKLVVIVIGNKASSGMGVVLEPSGVVVVVVVVVEVCGWLVNEPADIW